MSEEALQFKNRLRRLERKHSAMSKGYQAKLRSDGLIVMTPRRQGPRISARSVLLFLAAFFLFKGFLIANIGIDGYNDRVVRLEGGNTVEVAGAWVMQADPLALLVAEKIGPVLR
jgi:hypothetical protein